MTLASNTDMLGGGRRLISPLLMPRNVVGSVRPLILTFGGLACKPILYDRVLANVSGCDVVAVDYTVGSGPWDLPSLAGRVIRQLDARRAETILMGHSVGGALTLLIASLAPDRVQGVVVSNTGVNTLRHGDPDLPKRIGTGWCPQMVRELLGTYFASEVGSRFRSELEEYALRIEPTILVDISASLRMLDLSPLLGRISCPVLVAHGRLDRRRTPEDARDLCRRIRGASLVLLEGGHSPMVDSADMFERSLHDFLAVVLSDFEK